MKTSKPLNRRPVGSHKDNNISVNNNNTKDQICDICAQNVPGPEREKIFAYGKCDHHVCYVCSARLRVICDQSECPICRKKLESVIFSSNKNIVYEKYNLKDCIYNEEFKIYFENKSIQSAFDKLLSYECLECLKKSRQTKSAKKEPVKKLIKDDECNSSHESGKEKLQKQKCKDVTNSLLEGNNCKSGTQDDRKSNRAETSSVRERFEEDTQGLLDYSGVIRKVFPDVLGLKVHLNYVHRLNLCDLCLTHNKLFPFEYSYYTNETLRTHMLKGEPKTSHRGHPNCVLCHSTFFNNDELIQHMSREHFHCHLCGRQDSNMRIYFLDYNSLRDHFRARHFLCERDNCKHEQFTSAFDNRVDLQIHMVDVHGTAGMSRSESRQQRTITLDSAPHRARELSPNSSLRQNLPPNAAVVSTGTIATANSSRQQRPPESIQSQIRQQRLPARSEFPALGQSSTSSSYNIRTLTQTASGLCTDNYPSLSQTTTKPTVSTRLTVSQRITAGPSSSRPSFVKTVGGGNRNPAQLDESDFPALPEQPKAKSNKKPKPQPSSRNKIDSSVSTLDQLISASLTLSNRNTKFNGKRSNSKGGSTRSGKNIKQKPLKIQLS